jgi:hypothetical protein
VNKLSLHVRCKPHTNAVRFSINFCVHFDCWNRSGLRNRMCNLNFGFVIKKSWTRRRKRAGMRYRLNSIHSCEIQNKNSVSVAIDIKNLIPLCSYPLLFHRVLCWPSRSDLIITTKLDYNHYNCCKDMGHTLQYYLSWALVSNKP